MWLGIGPASYGLLSYVTLAHTQKTELMLIIIFGWIIGLHDKILNFILFGFQKG